jgi:hypothetical protein
LEAEALQPLTQAHRLLVLLLVAQAVLEIYLQVELVQLVQLILLEQEAVVEVIVVQEAMPQVTQVALVETAVAVAEEPITLERLALVVLE